jgi:hypothetical protein
MTIATVRTEISNRKPFPHVTRASARPVPTVGQSSGGGTVMAEAGGGGGRARLAGWQINEAVVGEVSIRISDYRGGVASVTSPMVLRGWRSSSGRQRRRLNCGQ